MDLEKMPIIQVANKYISDKRKPRRLTIKAVTPETKYFS